MKTNSVRFYFADPDESPAVKHRICFSKLFKGCLSVQFHSTPLLTQNNFVGNKKRLFTFMFTLLRGQADFRLQFYDVL